MSRRVRLTGLACALVVSSAGCVMGQGNEATRSEKWRGIYHTSRDDGSTLRIWDFTDVSHPVVREFSVGGLGYRSWREFPIPTEPGTQSEQPEAPALTPK
jgi:hypothetical protein